MLFCVTGGDPIAQPSFRCIMQLAARLGAACVVTLINSQDFLVDRIQFTIFKSIIWIISWFFLVFS